MELIIEDLEIKSREDELKTKLIRKEVQAAAKTLKERYPILKHQNSIGLSIFLVSITMVVASAIAYLKGYVNEWFMLFWVAFWTSFLHELEHDTIHYMYFKKNKLMQDFMMLGVWLFRPMTINPWLRRHLHFHHHRVSGTISDLEERGLTNGEKWGIKRLLTVGDFLLGGALRLRVLRKELRDAYIKGEVSKEQIDMFKRINKYAMLPFTILLYFIWYFFLIHHGVHLFCQVFGISYQSPEWIIAMFKWINPLVFIIILPNLFRMFCIHFITSNMHYYGDVEAGNIMQQTQVLDKWYFIPFQLFCCNFGSTHAIHHFVVSETFYIRQITANQAHKVMCEQGVRFNDLGTFVRANRYFS
jgi:fatty acid desaturase